MATDSFLSIRILYKIIYITTFHSSMSIFILFINFFSTYTILSNRVIKRNYSCIRYNIIVHNYTQPLIIKLRQFLSLSLSLLFNSSKIYFINLILIIMDVIEFY